MSTINRIPRALGVCRKCKAVFKVEGPNARFRSVQFCGCDGWKQGTRVELHPVLGSESAKKCDTRCMNAKGPMCDCSCGGHNHGAGW